MTKVGKILFTPNYVFGGNTAIVTTDQKVVMDPMFTGRPGESEVLDAEDPDLVRPGLLPGSAGQPEAVQVHRWY